MMVEVVQEEQQQQQPQLRRKVTGIGRRVWLFVSERAGDSHVEEVGKYSIMRRTGLPGRDLRVLDPMLSYPSTILGRERAIVINLVHIKAIVTANEVLMLNSTNPHAVQFVGDLQQRVSSVSDSDSNQVVLPFEFRAVEACLESACRCFESETETLEQEAYPALDELTSKISTLNLERVRQIKSRLVAISGRVQKVKDELEHLLDDDNDMAEMYLTQKQLQCDHSSDEQDNDDNNTTCLQLDGDDDDNNERAQDSENSHVNFKPNTEELEMLLGAYFAQIDGILQKLSDMSEYVNDTEACINIMLDDKQNQLLQMGVMLNTMNIVLNAAIVLTAIFSINIHIALFKSQPSSANFWEITFGIIGGCVALYIIAVGWCKKKNLLALYLFFNRNHWK